MPIRLIPESALELEPELERHYQQYERLHGGEDALAKVLLGDTTYVERVSMPKHNGTTTILREPRAAVRHANRLGIPTSKDAHRQRAEYFEALATTLDGAWQELVSRCVELFGKHGPLVSGIYRDHFPPEAKARLRFLSHGHTMAVDAQRLHHHLATTRSPLFS
jgi:hypothetical protein